MTHLAIIRRSRNSIDNALTAMEKAPLSDADRTDLLVQRERLDTQVARMSRLLGVHPYSPDCLLSPR
jgi:hypothetical protein